MIEIKTQEQLIELAARSVYALSGLRAFQRDSEENKPAGYLNKDPDVVAWENRADEFLKNIDAIEFVPLKQLITGLSNILNTQTNETIQP